MNIILTPEFIKDQKEKSDFERSARTRDLAAEEERLISSVNLLRAEEKEEKQRITKELADFEENARKKKAILTSELSDLSSKRKEEMTPVIELREKAEKILAFVESREAIVLQKEIEQKQIGEEQMKALEAIHEAKQIISEREEDLAKRENAVKAVEERTQNGALALSEKWSDFHTAVHAKNAEISEREAKVAGEEKANTEFRKTLEAKEADYLEKDREIKSRYAVLEASAAAIYKLKNEQHGN